ncbi:DNA methyltransferase [Rhizobium sp. WW_1]|jgi:site-specific DNA-methyltransferase (adenine-specific)|uniref:DNA-methyltransferase n=1 Tax=Rhizobium sp. WW_1 TaxID=1907375 RepID=UPI00068A6D9A|nr:DNA methyltransferase [Rhizobium sp. WW_1]RKD68994.1 site-specific DNA-methyltransferase (adenine-specific) [Rhizobium sp. WW_1]
MIQFLDGCVTLYSGDCLEVLASLPENSIDSAVMDPPYHLTSIVERFGSDGAAEVKAGATGAFKRASAGFMGKQWDGGDIAFQVETWRQVLRVLKPGGYLLAFASTRGFGRMSVAIEDAGFINHPFIAWIFAAGMPKATRIKACAVDGPFAGIDVDGWRYGGQALKPAIEPIYMGQKPFSEDNGTLNILRHGTGAINIDGCRVGTDDEIVAGTGKLWSHYREGEASAERRYQNNGSTNFAAKPGPRGGSPDGRWPANVIHDGSAEVIEAFPEAPGQQREVNNTFKPKQGTAVYGDYGPRPTVQPRDEGGSAARFFYSAKADADDRIGSKHPTVKPIDLMRYLVRLVTPPGGTVLDCFAGTGTTGEAAWREGFNAVLIEREPEYQHDIAERMRLCLAGPDEKKREIIKRRGLTEEDAGPLFGGAA